MHWFWRTAVASVGTVSYIVGCFIAVPRLGEVATDLFAVLCLPLGVAVFAVLYAVMTRRFGSSKAFPGLPWFLRGLIAFTFAMSYAALLMSQSAVGRVLHDAQYAVIYAICERLGYANRLIPGWGGALLFMIEMHVHIAVIVALITYGLLTRYLRPRPVQDDETRCRKCGYILRALTEPRCSECGERI